jgi:hypothetical protein
MVPRIRTRRQGSCQASAKHFQQCAEFLPLRNRGFGTLTVTILPIPFAWRGAATARAAVQSTAALFSSLVTGTVSRREARICGRGESSAARGTSATAG